MPPVALLGVITYGLPATGAVAMMPGLFSVTLPTVSPFFNAEVVKPDKVGVWP